MEMILDFLVNNYIWFLIISLILVFALIGYFVDTNEKNASKVHFAENENAFLQDELQTDENKTLKEMIESKASGTEVVDDVILEENNSTDSPDNESKELQ